MMELAEKILNYLKEFKAAKIIEIIKGFIDKIIVAPY